MFSLVDNIIGDSPVSQTWLALPTGVLKRGSGIQAIFDQVWVQRKSFLRLANEITLWLFKACFGHHFNPILSWSGFRISRFAKPLRSSTDSAVFSQSKLNIIEATVTSELGYLQQKTGAIICYDTSHGMRMYLERDAANNLIWLWKKHGPFLKVVLYGR